MAKKAVLRSSSVDLHGDLTLREELQSFVESINSEEKMKYMVNHRTDLPPVGYFANAELIERSDVYHAIAEPISFANREVASFDRNLLIEDAGIKITYVQRSDDITEEIGIAVDKNNFADFDTLQLIGKKLSGLSGSPMRLQLNMRKSYLPDPQIVFTLAQYYLILYPLLSPFLKKFGEKLAEDIAADTYKMAKKKASSLISKLVESTKIIRSKMVPKEKVLSTIFVIPGSTYIELHLKSNNADQIVEALKPVKLCKVHEKIMHFQTLMGVSEIYFKFNAKNKWEFIYLINHEGQVLGTKIAFSNRDKLMQRIMLNPNAAFSIGADAVKYEKVEKNNEIIGMDD